MTLALLAAGEKPGSFVIRRALEVLRNTSSAQANQAERTAVAVAYDRAFIANGSAGWTRALSDAVLHPKEYESLRGARLSFTFDTSKPVLTIMGIASMGSPVKAELRIRSITEYVYSRP